MAEVVLRQNEMNKVAGLSEINSGEMEKFLKANFKSC